MDFPDTAASIEQQKKLIKKSLLSFLQQNRPELFVGRQDDDPFLQNFLQNVIDACRPSLAFGVMSIGDVPAKKILGDLADWDDQDLIAVDVDDLLEAQEYFRNLNMVLFDADISHLKNLRICIDNPMIGDEEGEAYEFDTLLEKPENRKEWLNKGTVRLTVPSAEQLGIDRFFSVGPDSYEYAIATAYCEWYDYFMESDVQPYVQVGGWPYFIQEGESEDFVLAVNCMWADGGSIYLMNQDGGLIADPQCN